LNYKDHRSKLPKGAERNIWCSTPYDVDGEGDFVWSLMSWHSSHSSVPKDREHTCLCDAFRIRLASV